jgi:parvulin-like peptidyl-prolyl isomerase
MNVPTWGLRGLVSAIVLAVLASDVAAQGLFKTPTRPVATVNGEAITAADVEAVLRERPLPPNMTEAQRKQSQAAAVDMLIDETLMQQFLNKNGPRVDPAEVDKKFRELEEAQKKAGKTMQDLYKETGQSEAQLRTNILHVVQMLQWIDFVKKQLTEQDVKRYYDENRDFFDGTVVRASHIVIRVPQTSNSADRQTARAKLEGLRQQVVAGKLDFADAAKKYSECTSAPEGGDIGYFQRKFQVEDNIAKTAFGLKVGEVSAVIETDYGVHIVRVTDRKPGQPTEYEKIKDKVRDLCVEDMRLTLLSQQRKVAKIEVNLPN